MIYFQELWIRSEFTCENATLSESCGRQGVISFAQTNRMTLIRLVPNQASAAISRQVRAFARSLQTAHAVAAVEAYVHACFAVLPHLCQLTHLLAAESKHGTGSGTAVSCAGMA